MKLISKEICPVSVRDRLIKNLANQDIAVSDIVKAVEWAEAKCLELNEDNQELEENVIYAKDSIINLGNEIRALQEKLDNCIEINQ